MRVSRLPWITLTCSFIFCQPATLQGHFGRGNHNLENDSIRLARKQDCAVFSCFIINMGSPPHCDQYHSRACDPGSYMKVEWASHREQASKHHFSMTSASDSALKFLS